MAQDYLVFEDVQDEPTPEEIEENFHYYQVNQVKSIFELSLTKSDIPVIANAMVEKVLNDGNPLEVAEKIKVMQEIIDAVKEDKRFKDYTLEELGKWGKCFTSPTGVKIEPFEAGGRYNFKSCGDPVVIELEEKLKERQEFLKKLPKDGIDVTTADGELVHIYPAQKPVSTSTYKITLPK